MEQITVRVPATTANLAAGFDVLGCALTLYNTLSFRLLEILGDCRRKYSFNSSSLRLPGGIAILCKKVINRSCQFNIQDYCIFLRSCHSYSPSYSG